MSDDTIIHSELQKKNNTEKMSVLSGKLSCSLLKSLWIRCFPVHENSSLNWTAKRGFAIRLARMQNRPSHSTISKLGESAYNALAMTSQVNGDERQIYHFSYNLFGEEEGGVGFSELIKNMPTSLGSQRYSRRAFSKEEKQPTEYAFDKGLQRRNSIGHLPRKDEVSLARSHMSFCPREQAAANESTKLEGFTEETAASLEAHTRKYGLAETTNVSLMSHKLRKKAVCDSTDNSHYQRQFLRVLNKRFWAGSVLSHFITLFLR